LCAAGAERGARFCLLNALAGGLPAAGRRSRSRL